MTISLGTRDRTRNVRCSISTGDSGGGSRPLPLRARRVPCPRDIRGVYTIRRTHRLWVNSCDKADVPGRSKAADDGRSLSMKHRLRQPAFPRMYR
jgi:hypothetical protein